MKKMKLIFSSFVVCFSIPFLVGCNKHTHNFDLENPIWNWSSDHTSATLKFKCLGCESFSEEMVDDDIEVHTGTPTCTTGDITTYTASITYNKKEFKDVVSVSLDPLGHDFTSITVSGVNEDGYNALDPVTGLTVTKVCSRGDSVVAATSEVVIEYESDDDFLHFGETSIRVKIKNTSLYLDVPVIVNKVLVDKPDPDTTEFVYNQNTQQYSIPASKYYLVEGDSKRDAGTSKVTVSLANKTDVAWKDGSTDNLEYDFTIKKATPVISGMNESYSISCGSDIITSNIVANLGTVSVELYDEDENKVSTHSIKGGHYTLVAKVAGDNNLYEVVKTAPVVCEHDATFSPVDPRASGAKIGNKEGTCKKCGETAYKLMTHDEINADWGFGFGTNGDSVAPAGLTDFPEYVNSSKGGFRSWTINDTVKDVAFPRIDFTAFNNVSIVLHTNTDSTQKLYFGFGYQEEDNLISYADHGTHNLYSLNCVYDKDNSKLVVTINDNYGDKAMFTVNDTDVITGTSCLTLKVHCGAWRVLVIDDILLNHTCSNYVDVKELKYPGISKVCDTCFTQKTPTEETIIYDRDVLQTKCFGFEVDNTSITIGKDMGEDVGALKIGGDQGSTTAFNLALPKINFALFKNVSMLFSSNAAGSLIGFNDSNTVQTVSNTKVDTKSTISFAYDAGILKVTIESVEGTSVQTDITDVNIINGCKCMKLYVSLNGWHYLAFSKIILNK